MGFWLWLRSRFNSDSCQMPRVAFVLLLRHPRNLTSTEIVDAVHRGLGLDVLTGVDEPRGTHYILSQGQSTHIVQLGHSSYLVRHANEPFMADPAAAAGEISELRLRRAVAAHRAWISVELLRASHPAPVDDPERVNGHYQTIGPIIAELADDDALVLLDPETGQMNVFDPSLDDTLRSPDPRRAVTSSMKVPVVAIRDDDPRMLAAVKIARDRWPEFVAAFEVRQPSQTFSVKVRLAEGMHVEYMWVSVSALEGDYIYGRLDNAPVELRNARLGGRVRVPLTDLNDWTYLDGKNVRGGFTIEVLRKAREGK